MTKDINNSEIIDTLHPDKNEIIADTPEEKEESNIVHVIKSRGMFSGFLVA